MTNKFNPAINSTITVPAEIMDKINSDPEYARQADEANAQYFAKLAEIVSRIQKSGYTAQAFDAAYRAEAETNRFCYIKNVEINGSTYDVEIDLLARTVAID